MKILKFPWWRLPDKNIQREPASAFKPSPNIIHAYANDIEKYGKPLDSDFSNYFRKCAEFYKE